MKIFVVKAVQTSYYCYYCYVFAQYIYSYLVMFTLA